jgi:hypothetical protein
MELRLKEDKIMSNDFDLSMQKIWTNGALVSEKISEDVSSIIYSESDVMMLSDKATAKDSYKWETNLDHSTNKEIKSHITARESVTWSSEELRKIINLRAVGLPYKECSKYFIERSSDACSGIVQSQNLYDKIDKKRNQLIKEALI